MDWKVMVDEHVDSMVSADLSGMGKASSHPVR